jgi:phospholipid/cholesterol/gamma-HCH transport system ATP-binding protein
VDELIKETEEKFGVTSIVISHDMASVFRISDRITYLNFGLLAATGTPKELLESLDPSTMEFIVASGVSKDILESRRTE